MEDHDNSQSPGIPGHRLVRRPPVPLPDPIPSVGTSLPGDDESLQSRHWQAARAHFQPADEYEAFLAEQAADQSWSLARASQMVSFALYDKLMAIEPAVDRTYNEIPDIGKLSLAYLEIATQPNFESLLRFEHRHAQRLALIHRLLVSRPKPRPRS